MNEWDPDNEDHPRNAGAIRTAIMLGAEFFQDVGGLWQIKGIDTRSKQKTMPAWLFLATHGICIDANGSPIRCGEMRPEPASRFESYRKLALIMDENKVDKEEREFLLEVAHSHAKLS